MIRVLEFPQENFFFGFPNRQLFVCNSFKKLPQKSCFHPRNCIPFWKVKSCVLRLSSLVSCQAVSQEEHSVAQKGVIGDGENFTSFPHVQTLRDFPRVHLRWKVVMVRFDPMILLQRKMKYQTFQENAFSTIKYLHEAGAKVILVSSWSEPNSSRYYLETYPSTESVADLLSSMLELKVVPVKYASRDRLLEMEDRKSPVVLLLENIFHFKGERSNCPKFSEELASGVDILVNDAFSESHKVLASTVGVTRFCSACIAGFYFEDGVYKLKNIIKSTQKPYMAIIGGGKLSDKISALRFLASTCDGLFFVGIMAFQIMHALGCSVPMKFVEIEALKEAKSVVEIAKSRNIPLVFPIDVWCINDHVMIQMEMLSLCSIPEGWQPVDVGPRSAQEMFHLLSQCKKILWIGPLKFSSSKQEKGGIIKLAEALGNLSSCDVTFVGKTGSEVLLQKAKFHSNENFFKHAAVLWEVLKGCNLPGLMALDRAYPFRIDWSIIYDDPTRPLIVDVGSGNGLFLFGMARKTKDKNFLGLEINAKLVDRCANDVQRFGIHNVHFIATNATSNFRSIVSSYPGELLLVSIQCPNPDFNKPEYRWRMVQRPLIEAISDVLIIGGKVFLQSDIEVVALRMKNEFLKHGNGKLVFLGSSEGGVCNESGLLKQNPFGVPSDWEQHVLDRGNPMYRFLLLKVERSTDDKP